MTRISSLAGASELHDLVQPRTASRFQVRPEGRGGRRTRGCGVGGAGGPWLAAGAGGSSPSLVAAVGTGRLERHGPHRAGLGDGLAANSKIFRFCLLETRADSGLSAYSGYPAGARVQDQWRAGRP